MIISTAVSAMATVVIAVLTYQTKRAQDRSQEQISDLYKAIVISTLLSSNSDASQLHSFISKFKEYYDGNTPIFKK